MDLENYEEQEQTLVLLKILAFGNHEIEQDRFRDVEELFFELDSAECP